MFASLGPGAPATVGLILACLASTLGFEFSNDFHDDAKVVATIICTHSLKPLTVVV